jgi:o-succinylbenzoate synthase
MILQASFTRKVFQFGFKARTSRGLMRDKTSWFIKIWDRENPNVVGMGECGPLPGLSLDARPDFEERLMAILGKVDQHNVDNIKSAEVFVRATVPPEFPSIVFGLETALRDLFQGGKQLIFENSFVQGKPIPINGLIWMGDMDFMMNQINQKIAQGFNCIKLKVGGLDFDRECDILHYIRRRYYKDDITIRLDANGAFKVDEVLFKLNELSKFKVQSIEQPIKPGLPEMEELCKKSPIPVAFDEELIGVKSLEEKKYLLDRLKPQFIILKPTLHGGMMGCEEWISAAETSGIGWWITSALESNIGLNAVCQFTANYDNHLPQGLGTGMIYENNIPSPLEVKAGNIFYSPSLSWDTTSI